MKSPNGFKDTEIGRIPCEWSVGTVNEFCVVVDCRHVTAEFVMSGIPVASIGEVQSRYVDLSSAKHTTDEFYEHLIGGGRKPRPGDLIFSRNATVGEVAQVTESHPPFAMGQDVCLIRKKNANDSSDYIQSVIRSQVVGSQLENMMVGSTFRRVNVRQIKSLIIPLPPLAEQRAIAEALSDVDALINALDALITKKRHIKQGTMQQLLTGKKRLPGFTGEWQVVSFRDCLAANPDYGINAAGVSQAGDLPNYLRITDISDDGRFVPDARVAVNHPHAENYILSENEIVFARTGASVGKTYLYDSNDGELVFAGFLIRAKICAAKLNPKLFAAFTKTEPYWNWVRVMSMRSGQPGINGNEYAMLELNLPPTMNEQNAIAEILIDMDAEITALEQKRDKTKLIKQGMMQELLTGRVRLVKPEGSE